MNKIERELKQKYSKLTARIIGSIVIVVIVVLSTASHYTGIVDGLLLFAIILAGCVVYVVGSYGIGIIIKTFVTILAVSYFTAITVSKSINYVFGADNLTLFTFSAGLILALVMIWNSYLGLSVKQTLDN